METVKKVKLCRWGMVLICLVNSITAVMLLVYSAISGGQPDLRPVFLICTLLAICSFVVFKMADQVWDDMKNGNKT